MQAPYPGDGSRRAVAKPVPRAPPPTFRDVRSKKGLEERSGERREDRKAEAIANVARLEEDPRETISEGGDGEHGCDRRHDADENRDEAHRTFRPRRDLRRVNDLVAILERRLRCLHFELGCVELSDEVAVLLGDGLELDRG